MKHVLIADDEAHVIRVLKLVLEKAGYEVVSVPNGEEALKKVRERFPDVLLTDIYMPRMTGRELCAAIHQDFPERNFPILVMTSSTNREEREWVGSLDNIDLLEKPVSPRGLVNRLNELFRERDTGDKDAAA